MRRSLPSRQAQQANHSALLQHQSHNIETLRTQGKPNSDLTGVLRHQVR